MKRSQAEALIKPHLTLENAQSWYTTSESNNFCHDIMVAAEITIPANPLYDTLLVGIEAALDNIMFEHLKKTTNIPTGDELVASTNIEIYVPDEFVYPLGYDAEQRLIACLHDMGAKETISYGGVTVIFPSSTVYYARERVEMALLKFLKGEALIDAEPQEDDNES